MPSAEVAEPKTYSSMITCWADYFCSSFGHIQHLLVFPSSVVVYILSTSRWHSYSTASTQLANLPHGMLLIWQDYVPFHLWQLATCQPALRMYETWHMVLAPGMPSTIFQGCNKWDSVMTIFPLLFFLLIYIWCFTRSFWTRQASERKRGVIQL